MKEHWYNNINIFLPLENPFTYLVAKEKAWNRIFNTNSELSQNRSEKQIMRYKITNLLSNDICYLFIACFDWNIVIFQQAVVRIYYILKIRYFERGSPQKSASGNLWKPIHSIINCYTVICSFKSWKCGKEVKKLQKIENKRSFSDQKKKKRKHFHSF